jgi:hypothetical protein
VSAGEQGTACGKCQAPGCRACFPAEGGTGRRPWTDAERAALLDVARAHGADWDRAGAAVGRNRESTRIYVRGYFRREWDAAVAEHRAAQPAPAVEWTERRDAAVREAQAGRDRLAELVDAFRPVDLPPVDRPRVKVKPSSYVVVSSDHHWPVHDVATESIILQVIAALKPRAYILNGDGPDLLALSKYPKDARRGMSWPLRPEQHAAKGWWRAVAQAGAAWDIETYETESNHAGNGRASRWRRWLNENAGVLFGLDGFEEDVTYQRYFHPADVRVQMVDEVVLAGDLRVRHGELVRTAGGYSARAHGVKWGGSVLHGHTHRIGSSFTRRPGIPGVRPDTFVRAYETGCACRLDAEYAPAADWQNGFCILSVDDASGTYGVEQVLVDNGVANVAALGATLRA